MERPILSLNDVRNVLDAEWVIDLMKACHGVKKPMAIRELIEALKHAAAEGTGISPAYWLERLGVK